MALLQPHSFGRVVGEALNEVLRQFSGLDTHAQHAEVGTGVRSFPCLLGVFGGSGVRGKREVLRRSTQRCTLLAGTLSLAVVSFGGSFLGQALVCA